MTNKRIRSSLRSKIGKRSIRKRRANLHKRRARRKYRIHRVHSLKRKIKEVSANVPQPFGHYLTTGEWVNTQSPRPFYKQIYNQETYPLVPPKTMNSSLQRDFTAFEITTVPSFTAVVPGGRAWGPKGAVISSDNHLLWDVTEDHLDHPGKHPVFQEFHLPPVLYTTETVAVLTYRDSDNYFHWMYDVLPRLELFRHSPIPIDRYIVNITEKPFQLETLHALGVRKEQLIQAHPQMHLQVKNLVIGSWSCRSVFPKWPCYFLREKFLTPEQYIPNKGRDRIYISRAHAKFRKVKNEDEIMHLLAQFGFKLVVLDSMSVSDQAQLFSNAEIIAAPHGAALYNLVFCSPGTKVIELFSPTYVSPLYWIFSNYLNLPYYYLIGDDCGNLDQWINPHQLVEILRLAGLQ